jgi:hypothetical protein
MELQKNHKFIIPNDLIYDYNILLYFFPKVYTKHNKTPHSPTGETGGNKNEN